jgi:hypothetical protein
MQYCLLTHKKIGSTMMSCMHAGVLRGRPAPSEAAAQIVNYAAPLCSIVLKSMWFQ